MNGARNRRQSNQVPITTKTKHEDIYSVPEGVLKGGVDACAEVALASTGGRVRFNLFLDILSA